MNLVYYDTIIPLHKSSLCHRIQRFGNNKRIIGRKIQNTLGYTLGMIKQES